MTGIAHTVHKETTSTFKSLKTMVTLWEVVANGGSTVYLTIIPQAWIGSESIAHEAEGQMGCWLRPKAEWAIDWGWMPNVLLTQRPWGREE